MNKLIPLFILPCTLTLYVFDFHFCKPHPATQIEVTTEAVTETTDEAPDASVTEATGKAPTAPVAEAAGKAPTASVAEAAGKAPTAPVAEAAGKAPTASVAEAAGKAPTAPVAEAVTEAPATPAAETSAEIEATTDVFLYYPSDLIAEINIYRSSYGLSALSEDSSLDYAAAVRCNELLSSMSHTRPDGRSCSTVYAELGIYPSAWGENLAAGYCTSAGTASDWMSSDGHRANILNPVFTKCGVAHISCDYGYRDYWVILFSD